MWSRPKPLRARVSASELTHSFQGLVVRPGRRTEFQEGAPIPTNPLIRKTSKAKRDLNISPRCGTSSISPFLPKVLKCDLDVTAFPRRSYCNSPFPSSVRCYPSLLHVVLAAPPPPNHYSTVDTLFRSSAKPSRRNESSGPLFFGGSMTKGGVRGRGSGYDRKGQAAGLTEPQGRAGAASP
jgi:hypothetical protein